jgi:hypothetical protein
MSKAFLSLLWSTDNQVSAIRGYSFSNHAGLITQSICTTKLENNLSKYKQTWRWQPQGASTIHAWYFQFIMGIMLFLTDNTCSMDQTANKPCHYMWQILDLKRSPIWVGFFTDGRVLFDSISIISWTEVLRLLMIHSWSLCHPWGCIARV